VEPRRGILGLRLDQTEKTEAINGNVIRIAMVQSPTHTPAGSEFPSVQIWKADRTVSQAVGQYNR
jgi:hypothetical protein